MGLEGICLVGGRQSGTIYLLLTMCMTWLGTCYCSRGLGHSFLKPHSSSSSTGSPMLTCMPLLGGEEEHSDFLAPAGPLAEQVFHLWQGLCEHPGSGAVSPALGVGRGQAPGVMGLTSGQGTENQLGKIQTQTWLLGTPGSSLPLPPKTSPRGLPDLTSQSCPRAWKQQWGCQVYPPLSPCTSPQAWLLHNSHCPLESVESQVHIQHSHSAMWLPAW